MSLGALAFAVLLVLLLRAIMDGTVAKSTSYIDHVGADVFVATRGVTNMSLAASNLPDEAVAALAAQPGVAQAGGIVRMNAIVGANSRTRPGILIGYDPARELGGPWRLNAGRGVEGAADVVLDSVLADELGAKLGTHVSIAGGDFQVVGLSSGTAAIAGKVAFIQKERAQELLHLQGVASFVLLRLEPGVNVAGFVTSLAAAQPDLEVMTRQSLSDNDRQLLARLFVQPINVMSTVGLLVGLAIVGLTMYTTTAERLHDFGVLKAIGAPSTFLFRTVLTQALFLGCAGFVLGVAGVAAAGPLIVRAVPDIGVQVNAGAAAQALAAVLGMSLAGAVGPVVRILGVDPLVVFKR
jgi:putative ABC transport system permease protein